MISAPLEDNYFIRLLGQADGGWAFFNGLVITLLPYTHSICPEFSCRAPLPVSVIQAKHHSYPPFLLNRRDTAVNDGGGYYRGTHSPWV